MNLTLFSKLMRDRAKKLPVRVNEIKVEVATAGFHQLIENTPVDTGKAVSNWQVGVNQMPQDVKPPYVPGIDRSTEEQNKMAALSAAKQPLSTVKSGDVIHLTNNTEYIIDLHEGSSPQSPRGYMVNHAMTTMRFRVKLAKIFEGGK